MRRANHTLSLDSIEEILEQQRYNIPTHNRTRHSNFNRQSPSTSAIDQTNKKRQNSTHQHNNRNHSSNHKKRNQKRHKSAGKPKKCSLRLLERCSWPQCNHSCPILTNPFTGEEMRFLELLASFGLDIEAVATALGVDMATLNNMDHTELVNLLTQQVS